MTEDPLYSRSYRTWMLIVLAAVTASSSADRLILGTLNQALKRDLHMSDLQFGLLNGILFTVLYTLGGLPLGRLADRWRRLPVLAIAISIWSGMTMLSSMVGNFAQLALMRVGVSIGESGCSPTCYSLLSDHYPPRWRAGAVAIMGLGVPVGSMTGAFIGAWSLGHADWRTAFIIAGAPGLLIALLLILTLREPPRGSFDPPSSSRDTAPPMSAVLKRIAQKPTYLHLMACATLAIFCNTGINGFMPAFFVRVQGLSQAQAGTYFAFLIGIAATIGTTGLGLLISKAGRKDARWYGWGPAIVMAGGVPLFLIGYMTRDFTICYALLFCATTIGFCFLGPVVGATQNMVDSRMRASAAAILILSMQLIGGGIGPVFTGFVSDWFAHQHFIGDYTVACPAGLPPVGAAPALAAACREASAVGLRNALMVVSLFYFWGAFHAFMAARTIRRDLNAPPPVPEPVFDPGQGAAVPAG